MTWRRRIDLEAAIGRRGLAAGEAEWDVSLWDTGLWGSLEPTFDVIAMHPDPVAGCMIEAVHIKRGRVDPGKRVPPGTCEIELVWETPETGAWSFRPTTPAEIGDELRVRARVDAGDWIPIYRGEVRTIADDWQPNRRMTPFRVTLRCTDRLAVLAAVNGDEVPALGPGERPPARLARIAELARIDPYYLRLASGGVPLQASTFARNLLDEAGITVDSGFGTLHVDREGFIVYRPRFWMRDDERSAQTRITWTNEP